MDFSDSPVNTGIPDYLFGADNHNVGNTGGGSWFDPESWGTKFGNAGKFISASVLSGAASIYDTAATGANWFGADIKINDNQTWISSIDQDLGQYYSDNRQSIDLAGFVATSFVPGIGGIKVLNAGQAALRAAKFEGALGKNMSLFTGILAPSTQNFVKLAGAELKSAQSVYTTLNANTLKALGSGIQQNILEGAAFEVFVQATMQKSPVLSDQDNWDIAKNIVTGGLLGGAIGGAFEGAKSLSAIKGARVGEDLRMAQYTGREIKSVGTSPSDQIILGAENRAATPLPTLEVPAPFRSAAEQELYERQVANSTAAIAKKSEQIDLNNRAHMHTMSEGTSQEMVNLVADTQIGVTTERAISNWHNAISLTSPSVVTKAEKLMAKGEGEDVAARWISLHGDNAGQVVSEMPAILSIADRTIPARGQSVQNAILGEVRNAGFKIKDLWNPLELSPGRGWQEAEKRYIWADQILAKLPENAVVGHMDLPLLERYLKDGRVDFTLSLPKKQTLQFESKADLKQYILDIKDDIANRIMDRRLNAGQRDDSTTGAIAKIVNVKQSYLEGTRNAVDESKGLFAWQEMGDEFHQAQVARGVKNPNDLTTPSYFEPQTAKIVYKVGDMATGDGHTLDAMVEIALRQKEFRENADRVFASQAGDTIASRVEPITADKLATANSQGAGAGFLSFAKGAYGSLEAIVQKLGGVSKDLKLQGRKAVDDTLTSPLYNLAQKPEAAIEWSRVNQLLSKTSEDYVFDTENLLGLGERTLVAKPVLEKMKSGHSWDPDKDILQAGAPQYIQLQNAETAEALAAHHKLTSGRTSRSQERNAALGHLDQRDADIIRAVNPDPRDFKNFAFVIDPRTTGAGHSTMLFANTEKELQELITKTNRDFPEFKILLKSDTAEYHRARGSYEYSLGLNENYIDSALLRKGIYSNFYTKTDPKSIVDEILQHHYKGADADAASLMRLKHNDSFQWLEDQANQYSRVEGSRFGGKTSTEAIQNSEKNPYISYIKTALDFSSASTTSPWWSLNRMLDNASSRFMGQVRQTWETVQSKEDLGKINELLKKYGSQTAIADAGELALINHTAPKAELSKFVRGANAIMSRFTLGLDPLNALNNAIGANVLRGTEIYQLTKAIAGGNSAVAGDLAQLAKVAIPGVEGQTITSGAKLLGSSIKRFFDPKQRAALLAEYKGMGIIKDRLEQFASIQDDLALQGTESVAELSTRLGRAFTKAKEITGKLETATGNPLAEEFNRFISADVMRQITDVAQKHGLLSKAESTTYINTFVNRVEGNIIASQRPGIFQGPIGQAIGLFQSYQFNLIQNMFRYVAEGEKKDVAMLLGIQGTLYGLQGEPGFKFLNDHIVGTLSGNTQHRDIYDATRGILGKTGGDWLLYGTASNILQTNLYSRGDINPRNLTIVPTNIADVPFVGGMSKVFGTLYETAQKLGAGGDVWETIRQGIEHNGVSRPLAGLAQVSRGVTGDQVFSTSKKGTILGSNDLMSLATLSRIAGGRPLDEAVQNDTMFSINSYEAIDRKKKLLLAETIKTTQLGGGSPDENEITQFAKRYAELGGKQPQFAKYMMDSYMKANTSAAQILSQKLNNPLSYKIQQLMGGQEN